MAKINNICPKCKGRASTTIQSENERFDNYDLGNEHLLICLDASQLVTLHNLVKMNTFTCNEPSCGHSYNQPNADHKKLVETLFPSPVVLHHVLAENGGGIEIASACDECFRRIDMTKWSEVTPDKTYPHSDCDFCEMGNRMHARAADLDRKGLYFVR